MIPREELVATPIRIMGYGPRVPTGVSATPIWISNTGVFGAGSTATEVKFVSTANGTPVWITAYGRNPTATQVWVSGT